MTAKSIQRPLFATDVEHAEADGPSGASGARKGRSVGPAPVRPEDARLATSLPAGIRFGTTSWSFPGWAGILYDAKVSEKVLASDGLAAYAEHPLLRAVEIDRTYYGPLPPSVFRSLADAVPDDFRFVVKAHEDCTVPRFPEHARYGKRRGERNERWLDASYATEAVVGPFVEGFGEKGGAILFQFPPHEVTSARAFAHRLHSFLARLPKGPVYAVELRNAELLTTEYTQALESARAIHCHNVWSAMPPILRQARLVPPAARRPLLVRWLLRAGDRYEDARSRYAPFDRLVDEDPANRALVTDLVTKANAHGVPATVIVDNKAEGCAPASVFRLARAVAERSARLG